MQSHRIPQAPTVRILLIRLGCSYAPFEEIGSLASWLKLKVARALRLPPMAWIPTQRISNKIYKGILGG
jgi:hypothetical protein